MTVTLNFRNRFVSGAALLSLMVSVIIRASSPARAGALEDCAVHIPWGPPQIGNGAKVDLVCHHGYLSALDPQTKVPRWVAYDLTGPHTLGCHPRTGQQFAVDALAPAEDQATLKDYPRSGYDLGHMAPNQDFSWDREEQKDSFSFANVSPQSPGLNRQQWERGEEIVRAWAYQRGDIEVYVGPILRANDKRIGKESINVPTAFFKIAVDRSSGEGIGFVMAQKVIKKGPIAPFVMTVAVIEDRSGLKIGLPANFRQAAGIWDYSLTAWRAAHAKACHQ
jgi:endonuclease G